MQHPSSSFPRQRRHPCTPDVRAGGYTLIEMLMVLAVFSLISAAVFAAIIWVYRTHAYLIEQAYAIQDARQSVEKMARELREASYGSDGAYPLESIATNALVFYADVTGDSRVERVRYYLQGEDLMRGVTEATGTPLSYNPSADEQVATSAAHVRNGALGSAIFTYYNATGTQITDMNDVLAVRFVDINVIININPSRLPADFSVRTSASLRNLKDNL